MDKKDNLKHQQKQPSQEPQKSQNWGDKKEEKNPNRREAADRPEQQKHFQEKKDKPTKL